VNRSSAQGTLVEAPKAPRGVECEEGGPSLPGEGPGEGARPLPVNFFLLYDLKLEHFGALFKLDLTEETRMQLQEEAIASFCLILATSMLSLCPVY